MIPLSFYENPNVVEVAKQLLGKLILTKIDGKLTGGFITETEAYAGVVDRASHAYGGRRTERTEIMYAPGGVAYVYLCYGMHFLLNIVTGAKDVPHAVLIRAIKPSVGIEIIEKRRNHKKPLSKGPGTLSQALGITRKENGYSLASNRIWLEEGTSVESIEIGPRVGIDYAGEDASLPYRFIAQLAKMEI